MIESQLQAAYAIRTILSTYTPTKRMIESQLQASSRQKVDSRHIGSLLPVIGRQLQEDKAMIIKSPLQREPYQASCLYFHCIPTNKRKLMQSLIIKVKILDYTMKQDLGVGDTLPTMMAEIQAANWFAQGMLSLVKSSYGGIIISYLTFIFEHPGVFGLLSSKSS
jgi:hypothetical protein